ncbi:iron complex outermembrane receptor protein [Novosphingobium sp. PhB165]|uniref:TonB-dependent receptor n=1 Tax=Novosphingobium sp. PhB165 TaxID=2485105 RepID=UPI0010D2585A|nr:TonB-dependent receptor [Novosphingobium sp. PhB165]TCM15013.1 iron complex outermembrane receptor protein [Novosphingobium sp. PhB165]
MRNWLKAALAAGTVLSGADGAYAQSQQAPSGGVAVHEGDIVVTARRRDESLSTVPAAITALSGSDLVERGVRTDSDLQRVAPGLTIRQTQGNNSLTYSIRGQTADTFSGSPSAVIAYLNEVPLTINSASSFYDLANVQVLKGPQGTLFGRNATGGAVLYNTAKPTDKLEASLRGRVGNLDTWEGEGMLNVPLLEDKILLRGAFDLLHKNGYIRNLLNDERLGDIRRESGRGTLTIKPTDTISNTTMLQYTNTRGTNTGASYTYSVYSCGQTNNGFALTCGAGSLFGPSLDAIAGPGAWNAYLAAHPDAYAPGLIDYVNEQRRIGPYKTRHPGGASHHGEDWFVTNTTEFELSDSAKLRNIFGWSDSKTRSEQPQLGAPFVTILTANAPAGEFGNQLKVRSVSDELQLVGDTLDSRLDYIVGYYMQRQRSDTLWPQTYFDVSPIIPPSYVTNNFRIRNKTDAVYGQVSYEVVTDLKLTGGLRYTWERVSIAQLPGATYTYGAPDQHKTFSDPSWEVGLEYKVTSDWFAYLKTRGSFRSGGFNGAAPPVNATATDGGNLFNSEHTQDIEGGLKFAGQVMGRPANFASAVFIQWVQDVQRVEFPDPDGPGGLASIAVTANVPSQRIWGFEAQGNIRPAEWLELGGSAAYTNATFTDGHIELFGTPYSYGPVGDTPKFSGTAYAQVFMPVAEDAGQVSLRGDLYGQTAQYFSNAADSIAPGTKLPGYVLVNARLDWNGIMGSDFSAALFAKNLTDKAYFVGGMTLAAALGHNAAAVGEPRTYGLEISYKF